jgi:hypothetical protein
MKIQINKPILDENGKELGSSITCLVLNNDKKDFVKKDDGSYLILDHVDNTKRKTVKDVIKESVLHESTKLTGEQKSKRYEIWIKTNQSDNPDYTVEELSIIKECIGDVQPILIVGQCLKLISL